MGNLVVIRGFAKSYVTAMVRQTKIENLLNKLKYIVVSLRINSIIWEEMWFFNNLHNTQVYPVAAPGIFSKVFLKKHKLHNLIKRDHILITTTIKKTFKYIKFTIAFYEFSYFEIINYYCLVVLLICLSFINYNLLYCCFINYKIINCCLA